jgi:hypothetical protein
MANFETTTDLRKSPWFNAPILWGPVIAGALTAAALAIVLHSFAVAIGLGVSSTAPTWRDASIGLFFLSGIYLLAVALVSYGIGGYVAGTLRPRLDNVEAAEIETHDGTIGILVWAFATLLTVALVAVGAMSVSRLAAPSGGGAGPAASVAGENIIAYDIDKLFRGDRKGPEVDFASRRAEVARILLTASGHAGVMPDDRTYLVRLVSSYTGLGAPEAEKRVDGAVGSARANIKRARASSVLLAFMAGAAALLGAAAAWFGSIAGGRDRQTGTAWIPPFGGPDRRKASG